MHRAVYATLLFSGLLATGLLTSPASAADAPQAATPAQAAPPAPAAPAGANPAPLVIHFDSGSTRVGAEGQAVLDHAARLFREGNPIVMIISGATDAVGSPERNLQLSQERDRAVLRGLVARGLPTQRFQLLAKGETDPAVPADPGVAQPENRRVEITWR